MIFRDFDAELNKSTMPETSPVISPVHLLESLDNQIWKGTLKENKLNFFVANFRSWPGKPRRDKQDLVDVEQ